MAISKIVPVEDAVAIVRPGDTVATSGFVGVGTPDAVIAALKRASSRPATPRDLTLVFAAAPGDGQDKGLNRLARDGLVRRVVGGHFGLVPEARPHGDRGIDRGLQPAARLHLAALSRDRRTQGGPALEGRPAGPSSIPRAGRRQAQRPHHGGSGRAPDHRRRALAVLQGLPDPGRDPARHDGRSRTATSPWSARR